MVIRSHLAADWTKSVPNLWFHTVFTPESHRGIFQENQTVLKNQLVESDSPSLLPWDLDLSSITLTWHHVKQDLFPVNPPPSVFSFFKCVCSILSASSATRLLLSMDNCRTPGWLRRTDKVFVTLRSVSPLLASANIKQKMNTHTQKESSKALRP